MARRGGPPDIKGTLGSLLQATLEQVGAVREVVEQQTRSRAGFLDQALPNRHRKETFARLGELVYQLAQRGELGDIALEPEIAMTLAELEQEGDSEMNEFWGHRRGEEAVSSKNYVPNRSATPQQKNSEYRVWRPVLPEDDELNESSEDYEYRPKISQNYSQSNSSSSPAHPENQTIETASTSDPQDGEDLGETPKSSTKQLGRSVRAPRRSAHRIGGGIKFMDEEPRPEDLESEEDLAAYMHEDDVP